MYTLNLAWRAQDRALVQPMLSMLSNIVDAVASRAWRARTNLVYPTLLYPLVYLTFRPLIDDLIINYLETWLFGYNSC